ncbi:phosphoribosyltransferase [Aquabacterium humicola]|uniref:phosphoribosyltransferase n=1 Tax=Aquabacterium humicola TaxID=3237377 RepID=UPI002542A524|nr:phosphoribosyltransferase family protein [Rubrivivax pictus]
MTSWTERHPDDSPAFANRAEAGRLLAERVAAVALRAPPVVLALPRGGVPVGAAVARRLQAPLDLLLVRKIGVPWQPELALAAVVEGDPPDLVIDEPVQRAVDVGRDYIELKMAAALQEIARRRALYLRGRAAVPIEGRCAIVVDDGIATGTTVRAALRALKRRRPAQLLLAVPVAPPDTVAALRDEVDELICLAQPVPFVAIGEHYRDFHQIEDDEVLAALDSVAGAQPR